MNKKISKILAVALAFVLCFAMAAPAFAAGNYTGMATESDKTSTTFDKYLVMDADANVPAVMFSFTIAAGTGVAAGTGTVAVLPGVMTPTPPTVGTAVFTSTTEAKTTLQTGDEVDFNASTQKYAKQQVTVDFSGVTFTEPGIYRYVITETAGTVKGIVNDTNNVRYLDVYVEDASTDSAKLLKIAGYVLHTVEDATVAAGSNMGADRDQTYVKSKGFTNQYITHDLTFSKTVSGNQASRDKYFAFTVSITDALPNTKYSVNITGAEAKSGTNAATIADNAGQTNVTEIETDEFGAVTKTFYLQHGQSITIEGLTDGAKWEITENAEDYKSSVVAKEGETPLAGAADTDGIHDDSTAAFTNTREGVVPTGVLLTVAPFAVLMLVGIAGIVAVLLKKKRASAE